MYEFPIIGWTVSWFVFILMIAVWVAIAFWPARVAARKGHSFLAYFIFSLFFFPLALLVAYLSNDRGAQPTVPAEVE